MEPVNSERRTGSVPLPLGPSPEFNPELVELIRTVQLVLAEPPREAVATTEVKPDPPKEEKKEKKPEEQMPLFWKLCSAALLSVSALIVVTLYNQLNATATQLNSDVGLLRNELSQLRTDLVPKDDYNLRVEQIVNGIKDIQASNKAAAETWRERVQEQKATVSDLRQQLKSLERDLQGLREQLSILEQRAATTGKSAPLPKDRKKGS